MKQWAASVVPDLAAKLETEEEEQSKKKKKQPLTIAIDGKAIRSTGKMKKIRQSLAYISAQIGELGLTLAQRTVESKSNEIPGVAELIQKLAIKGGMVVADAMNCQYRDCRSDNWGKSGLFVKCEGQSGSTYERYSGVCSGYEAESDDGQHHANGKEAWAEGKAQCVYE